MKREPDHPQRGAFRNIVPSVPPPKWVHLATPNQPCHLVNETLESRPAMVDRATELDDNTREGVGPDAVRQPHATLIETSQAPTPGGDVLDVRLGHERLARGTGKASEGTFRHLCGVGKRHCL